VLCGVNTRRAGGNGSSSFKRELMHLAGRKELGIAILSRWEGKGEYQRFQKSRTEKEEGTRIIDSETPTTKNTNSKKVQTLTKKRTWSTGEKDAEQL